MSRGALGSRARLGGLLLSAMVLPTPAWAFCRTTTCSADDAFSTCAKDANDCTIPGLPLWWPDKCVTFGVQAQGSVLRGISFDRAEQVAAKAFQTWISADCGNGETPSIAVVDKGKIYCDLVEYSHDPPAPNANLIVFRDSVWPYTQTENTIALTTITYAIKTGEILDADIEVNSRDIELTTGDEGIRGDLQSILTHEVGHFFGLAHSKDETSSMNPYYDLEAATFRSLSDDDRKGICSIYPPGELVIDSCRGEEPRHGFSRYCGNPTQQAQAGCNVASVATPVRKENPDADEPARSQVPWWAALLATGGVVGFARSRRRKRRSN